MILTTLSVSSCYRPNFDPDFYVGDYESEQIINEDGKIISCNEPELNEFGCMHVDKIKELRRLLDRCQIGSNNKRKIDNLIKVLRGPL